MSYRLFGAETSAYSTKMRSYLRYKGVAFDWTPRTQETEEELQRLARFPTLPILVTSSGFAVHDTTPMMEALEAAVGQRDLLLLLVNRNGLELAVRAPFRPRPLDPFVLDAA